MNYLAHAYLSFGRSELLLGNMIADFVKGNKLSHFPNRIQQGIRLHRAIDRFTDEHKAVMESKQIFKPHFYLSSGVFTDILFDHFLANDEEHFSNESLLSFTTGVYKFLTENNHYFDDPMHQFFGYMTRYNWLYGYRFEEGLSKSILGICKRYPRLGDGHKALEIILEQKENFQLQYNDFFPQLIKFSKQWISENSDLELPEYR